MNKNPFGPQAPAYTPMQPPLPPGPPPAQSGQPDYSAYWAAQQPQAQPSALYANYGYGNQQQHWQRQQGHAPAQPHQQQQHFIQPPQPAGQAPPPPPAAAAYTPYQPQASFQQPYQPQVPIPQLFSTQPHQHQHQHQHQPQQQPQQQPIFFPQVPQQPQHHLGQRRPPHNSPQNQPPAKRARFEGPNLHRPMQNSFNQPPPPPQLSAPPPPPIPQGPQSMPLGRQGGSFIAGRGGIPVNQGRNNSMRGGRGGSMNRGGGLGANRGRGGGSIYGGSGRGGFGGGQNNPQLRGHTSQGSFSQNRQHQHQHQNRRGGSSTSGGNVPLRGGRQGYSNQNRRQDHGGSSHSHGSASVNQIGKRPDNKRTFADFKIVGLEVQSLEWKWGVIPTSPSKSEKKDSIETSSIVKKEELATDILDTTDSSGPAEDAASSTTSPSKQSSTSTSSAGPSRLRIYFHTPVTADDARPVVNVPTSPAADLRKGKRKKIEEEEDGDTEDGRGEPRPRSHRDDVHDEHGGPEGTGRGSVAPSVATEAASEHDWLMAAIGDDQGGGSASADGEAAEVSQIEGDLGDGDHHGEGNEEEHDHEMLEATQLDELQLDETQLDDGDYDATPLDHLEGEHMDVTQSDGQNGVQRENTVVPESFADLSASGGDDKMKEVAASGDASDAEPQDAPLAAQVLVVSVPDTSGSVTTEAVNLGVDEAGVVSSEDHPPPYNSEHPAPPSVVTASTAGGSSVSGISTTTAVDTSAQSVKSSGVNDLTPKKMASANRLSISYAGGSRRLVINASIVEKLKVFRSNGKIEVIMSLEKDDSVGAKGVLIEGLSGTTKSYCPLETLFSAEEIAADHTVPPFSRSAMPCTVILVAHLDHDRPLTEARWLRSGDVQEWLKSEFGRMFWVSGEAADGWEKKVEVVDPDPPPTIHTLIHSWAASAVVGSVDERERFVKLHMAEPDNVFEILLRLVRGERATSVTAAPTILPLNPLMNVLKQSFPHGAQQTQISLAVLGILRIASEFAEKALGEKGKTEVDERVGELIRSVPTHLLHKALDGMFKEWKADKKGTKRS